MVVNGKKIFFEYHPFEKRGGVNPMGGYFLKKVWREALFATPRPVLGHPPFPFRGGYPHRIEVQNIYTTICGSPSKWSKSSPISLNKD